MHAVTRTDGQRPAVVGWLPRGHALDPEQWEKRHRLVLVVVALHVPVVFAWSLLSGLGVVHSVGEVLPVLLFVAVAARVAADRTVRSLCATLGLVTCSALLVHLSGGLIEFHFHYFIAVALIAVYQDWRPFLAALVFVVGGHLVGTAVAYDRVYNHGNPAQWWWALVHGGFILAAAAVQTVLWRHAEEAKQREDAVRQEVLDGEIGLLARLRQARQYQDDLVHSATHEFRNPMAAIVGATSTLLRADDRLTPAQRRVLLEGARDAAMRLSRLLEDMLAVAEGHTATAGRTTVLGVRALLAEEDVDVDLQGAGDATRLDVAVPEVLLRRMLVHVVAAARELVDGDVAGTIRLDDHDMTLVVPLPGVRLSAADRERLFQPFGWAGTLPADRDGGALRLHVARRLASVHDGVLDVVALPAGQGETTPWSLQLQLPSLPAGEEIPVRGDAVRLPEGRPTGAAVPQAGPPSAEGRPDASTVRSADHLP